MIEKYAVRNLRLCTKECLCLYVCPTGATDTENSIIDVTKCIGCGACAEVCPSAAITMMPKKLPPQQQKNDEVILAMRALIQSKSKIEKMAGQLPDVLGSALEKSSRLMAEDLYREAGYMLPQSENTKLLLEEIRNDPEAPQNAINALLNTLSFHQDNNTQEKWKCTVCGYIHEGPMTADFKCPVCKQGADKFIKLE